MHSAPAIHLGDQSLSPSCTQKCQSSYLWSSCSGNANQL